MRTQDGNVDGFDCEVDLFDVELVRGRASPLSPHAYPSSTAHSLMHTTHHHTQTQSQHPPCFYTSTRAQLAQTFWRVAGKRVCRRALQSFIEEVDLDGSIGYKTDGELSATDPGFPYRYCPRLFVISLVNDCMIWNKSESESGCEAEAEAEAEVPSPSSVVYPAECVVPTPFIEACRECPPVDAPTPAPTPAPNAASTTAVGQPSCHSLPTTKIVSSAC